MLQQLASGYVKMLSSDMRHFGLQYKEGLNEDPIPFYAFGSCKPGGLYYTTLDQLGYFLTPNWPLLADVSVPPDAQVYAEPCATKWKASQLVISNIRSVYDFLNAAPMDLLIQYAKQSPAIIRMYTKTAIPLAVFQCTYAHYYRSAVSLLDKQVLTVDVAVELTKLDRLNDLPIAAYLRLDYALAILDVAPKYARHFQNLSRTDRHKIAELRPNVGLYTDPLSKDLFLFDKQNPPTWVQYNSDVPVLA